MIWFMHATLRELKSLDLFSVSLLLCTRLAMSYSVCLSLAKRFPGFKGKGKGKSKGNVPDRDHEPGIHDPFGRDSISGRDDSRDDQDDVDDVYDEDSGITIWEQQWRTMENNNDDDFENNNDGAPASQSGPRPDHNLGSGPITIGAPARSQSGFRPGSNCNF